MYVQGRIGLTAYSAPTRLPKESLNAGKVNWTLDFPLKSAQPPSALSHGVTIPIAQPQTWMLSSDVSFPDNRVSIRKSCHCSLQLRLSQWLLGTLVRIRRENCRHCSPELLPQSPRCPLHAILYFYDRFSAQGSGDILKT